MDFANKERIINLLYPLFVDDIKAFLYHPSNYARTNAVMAAAANRQAQTSPNVVSFTQPSQVPRRSSDGRPMMSERSMSFPTPPSSASSITNGTADLPWVNHTGLSVDTSGIPPITRSLPGTPATSPSSAVHTGSQTYGALTDSHLHRQSLQFEPSFKRDAITTLHLSYPTGSQFSSRRASSASDMGPPPATVHSRLNTVEKDQLDVKRESLPESQEEGYQNDLHYGVPPGTPISASNNQVYNTPSIVAMKGRVDNPGTPTHTHSPSGNVSWSQKHDPPSQNEYAISSQTHHARQLSYHVHANDDQGQMVSQNGVSRNIFDSTPIDRDSKLSSLDYGHGDDVLQGGDMPNGHNLSHGSLPSIKQEQLINDGPPSSKRRRTINQDSLPYNLGGSIPIAMKRANMQVHPPRSLRQIYRSLREVSQRTEASCIHPIRDPGIPTPTNTGQSSAIHPPTVVNVRHLENKAVYIVSHAITSSSSYHHDFSQNHCEQRGSVWRVCLGVGGIRFARSIVIFCCRHFHIVYHQCIHMEREEKRETREIKDGTVRGINLFVILGEIVYPSASFSEGGLQWVSKSRLHHYGLSLR